MMEAGWKIRGFLGLVCCLGVLAAASTANAEKAKVKRTQSPNPKLQAGLTADYKAALRPDMTLDSSTGVRQAQGGDPLATCLNEAVSIFDEELGIQIFPLQECAEDVLWEGMAFAFDQAFFNQIKFTLSTNAAGGDVFIMDNLAGFCQPDVTSILYAGYAKLSGLETGGICCDQARTAGQCGTAFLNAGTCVGGSDHGEDCETGATCEPRCTVAELGTCTDGGGVANTGDTPADAGPNPGMACQTDEDCGHTITLPAALSTAGKFWIVFVGRSGQANQGFEGVYDGGVFPGHQNARDFSTESTIGHAWTNQCDADDAAAGTCFSIFSGTGDGSDPATSWQPITFAPADGLGTSYFAAVSLNFAAPADPTPDCSTEPNGACCFPAECVTLRGFECGQNGGTYLGDGSQCGVDQCPTCGNNIDEIGEECDGTDSAVCQGGICRDDCACLCALSAPGAAPNDCCTDSIKIDLGDTEFSTTDAGTDGLPVPAGQCNDFGSNDTYNDVWYTYNSECSGILVVSTCEQTGGWADYDSDIDVYLGCDTCPPTNDDLVGCNDDAIGLDCGGAVPGFGCCHSNVEIAADAGSCYRIRVGGWGPGDFGSGGLHLECLAAGVCGNGIVEPGEECDSDDTVCLHNCTDECQCASSASNDDCVNKMEIGDGDFDFITLGANTDGVPSPPGLCTDFGNNDTYHDLWYNYTASCSGQLTVSTCEQTGGSADYDTDLVVYTGCDTCPPSVEDLLGCNDDTLDFPCGGLVTADPFNCCHSNVVVPVTEGDCYKIRVGGWGPDDQGSGVLHIDCTNPETLHIKQGSNPAPVNPNSNGVIPMVLAGSATLDVSTVNRGSLRLGICGGDGSVAPLDGHYHVSSGLNHPAETVHCGGCSDNDNQSSDGIDDLAMKFSTNAVIEAFGIGVGDGVVTVVLTGTSAAGPFTARDCMMVVPPGAGEATLTLGANVNDTYISVTPIDINVDGDGFANFSRGYIAGTNVTVSAPRASEGRKFVRWSVDGVLQDMGVRTLTVTATEDISLKAYYKRQGRIVPDRPSDRGGDLD